MKFIENYMKFSFGGLGRCSVQMESFRAGLGYLASLWSVWVVWDMCKYVNKQKSSFLDHLILLVPLALLIHALCSSSWSTFIALYPTVNFVVTDGYLNSFQALVVKDKAAVIFLQFFFFKLLVYILNFHEWFMRIPVLPYLFNLWYFLFNFNWLTPYPLGNWT